MISVPSAVLGGVVFLLLIAVWIRSGSRVRESNSPWDPAPGEGNERREKCPAEIVEHIFSEQDLEFVSGLNSPYLRGLFRGERSAVAQHWVQQTSAEISRIMREHLESSRRSADLEFRTEAGIFLRYVELKLICGVLYAAIELAGPQRVRGLALHASRLSERIGEAQREIAAAARASEMHGA